jgi:hypothetical protein
MKTLKNLERAIKNAKNTRSWLDMITSIARSDADVLIGIIPRIDGKAHVLANEYEPFVYFEAVTETNIRTHISANEYEPYVYFKTVPEINNRTRILANEYEPHGYYGIVPKIYMRVDILSMEV